MIILQEIGKSSGCTSSLCLLQGSSCLRSRQLAIVEHDIADYQVIPGLQCPTTELHEEWLIYMQLPPDSIATSTFWKSMAERYPLLSAVAMDACRFSRL